MDSGNVLHVEDDGALRGLVTRTLKNAGYTVESLPDGLEALKRLRSGEAQYALVILDLVLPWINGLELLTTMRSEAALRDIPVLVTTGTFVTPNEFAGDRHVSVLQKPFSHRQLVVAVETMIHRPAA